MSSVRYCRAHNSAPRAPINLATNSLKKHGRSAAEPCTLKPQPYIKNWRILSQNGSQKKGQHPTPNLPAACHIDDLPHRRRQKSYDTEMPAGPSRSPRKSGSPAKERTRWNRIVSATPLQGTRSNRTSLRAAKAEDALAREREYLISRRLERLGLPTEGEIPVSLGALLKQRGSPSVNGGFGNNDFGGFDGYPAMDMDYGNDDEWCSEEELEDDIEDELQSTRRPLDHAIRTETEVNNWTKFIDIVTGDTVIQGCSPFYTCTKSTRSIPTISLSAGILNCSLPLIVKDMSI